MRFSLLFAIAASIAVLVSTPASAQDFAAQPVYGAHSFNGQSRNDPYRIEIAVQGDVELYDSLIDNHGYSEDAEELDYCDGVITSAPTAVLTYTASEAPLIISAGSEEDYVLFVISPDGAVHCSDDDGEGDLNPAITFDAPVTGRYLIWVGTYFEEEPIAGVLQFSASESL